MSGQYPARDFNASKNLKPDEPTITKLLQDAGYTTGHFGKWHMSKEPAVADSPGDFGIDDHFTSNQSGTGKTRREYAQDSPRDRRSRAAAAVHSRDGRRSGSVISLRLSSDSRSLAATSCGRRHSDRPRHALFRHACLRPRSRGILKRTRNVVDERCPMGFHAHRPVRAGRIPTSVAVAVLFAAAHLAAVFVSTVVITRPAAAAN